MKELNEIKERIETLKSDKAVAKDRLKRATEELASLDKECREKFDLSPNEVPAKLEELEKLVKAKGQELSEAVTEMESQVAGADN